MPNRIYKNSKYFFKIVAAHLLLRWMKSNIPNGHSSVAITLFLFIAMENLRGAPPSLKVVFASVDFSEHGVRPHIHAFLNSGLCELLPSHRDRRVKLLMATPLMVKKIQELSLLKI